MLFFFLVPVQRKKNFLVELLNSENRILLKDETSSVRYIWAKNPEPKIMQPSEDYSLLLTGQKYVDAYFLVERVILKKKKLSFLLSVRLQVLLSFRLVSRREAMLADEAHSQCSS